MSGYLIIMSNGLYVRKGNGDNSFVKSPYDATLFADRELAEAGKPGHHRDMGGSGFKGRIVSAAPEFRYWKHRLANR